MSASPIPTPDATALVVDLDGTLSRTDTLDEGLLALAGSAPAAIPGILMSLRQGRAAFKARVADHHVVAGETLPLNEEVIERVKAARAEGRQTALVTAADQRQADAVAAALPDLFDQVVGSSEGRNLKGEEKARFLIDIYGKGGFDYIGDSQADVPVWKAARQAYAVGATSAVEAAARNANAQTEIISRAEPTLRPLIKAMRPYQWSKNAMVFLPVLAAHDLASLPVAFMAFIAFSLTASSVYLLNDLLDLASDRAHPRKRERPFASGVLSLRTGLFVAFALLIAAVLVAVLATGRAFLSVLAIYFVATTLYSFWLKKKLIVDVITLAGLYTIRIVAGAAATAIVLSPWMLGFSMFVFLALAAVKRQAELTDQVATGRSSSGRAYVGEDLPILRGIAISASHATILVLALYIASDDVQKLYRSPDTLWAGLPLLLYWLLRTIMKTHRGHMTDDPIVFAVKDRVSQFLIAAMVVVALAAI